MKLFDIESDGLLEQATVIWILTIYDFETKTLQSFSDYDPELPPLEEGVQQILDDGLPIGHNIIGYDFPLLRKLLGVARHPQSKVADTLVMSLVFKYVRNHRHSLEGWGEYLQQPKKEIKVWSEYTPEIRERCETDVMLNVRVYERLSTEYKRILKNNPLIEQGLRVEHRFAKIAARIERYGWQFNREGAIALIAETSERMAEIEDMLEPMIGLVLVKLDKRGFYKEPKWNKNGKFSKQTADYFGIPQENGLEELPYVLGAYSRVSFKQGRLSSDQVLKQWLTSIGWKPDEWNYEKVRGKIVQKSAKLTLSSLELLGEIGLLVDEYGTIKNRHGILEGWVRNADAHGGRLHGTMFTIGTPTMRCRHNVVANLPTVDSKYGKEMRALLEAPDGCVLVGADSSGNQMRGLCHYIGNEEFTSEVISGDVHMRNAIVLQEFTDNEPVRRKAKPFLFAFLFGGGPPKLASIVTGKRDKSIGELILKKFQDSVPGLQKVRQSLEDKYIQTASQYGQKFAHIRGIDGRPLFVDSKHKLLVALLQALESLTCKAAAVYLEDKLIANRIRHEFVIHYHDELAVVVSKKDAEQTAEFAAEAFREAPKAFGVMCMDGKAMIGHNYAEIH